MILAIDPGTTTGWASFSPEHGVEWGVWRFDKEPTRGHRFSRFRARLHQEVVRLRIDLIGLEAPFVASQGKDQDSKVLNANTVAMTYGWQVLAAAYCADHGLPEPVLVPQQSWRASFLPGFKPKVAPGVLHEKARAERQKQWKQAAKREAARRGWEVRSADAAEALGILHHLRLEHEPTYAAERGRFEQTSFLGLLTA